jgi:hypothetical protein
VSASWLANWVDDKDEGTIFVVREIWVSSGFWTKLIWSVRVGRALPVLAGELAQVNLPSGANRASKGGDGENCVTGLKCRSCSQSGRAHCCKKR